MKTRLLRLGSRLMVLAILAAALIAQSGQPVRAASCGDWYNLCNDSCNSEFDQCMLEHNDYNFCQNERNHCYAFCQAGFYDCIGNGGPPFCVPRGTEWICV